MCIAATAGPIQSTIWYQHQARCTMPQSIFFAFNMNVKQLRYVERLGLRQPLTADDPGAFSPLIKLCNG
jgi:hypothetical protein